MTVPVTIASSAATSGSGRSGNASSTVLAVVSPNRLTPEVAPEPELVEQAERARSDLSQGGGRLGRLLATDSGTDIYGHQQPLPSPA